MLLQFVAGVEVGLVLLDLYGEILALAFESLDFEVQFVGLAVELQGLALVGVIEVLGLFIGVGGFCFEGFTFFPEVLDGGLDPFGVVSARSAITGGSRDYVRHRRRGLPLSGLADGAVTLRRLCPCRGRRWASAGRAMNPAR